MSNGINEEKIDKLANINRAIRQIKKCVIMLSKKIKGMMQK
mgnify:CR=1 FL=1